MHTFHDAAFAVTAQELLQYSHSAEEHGRDELSEELSDFAYDLATISALPVTTESIPELEQRPNNALGLWFQSS